ncbi:hypothetical protein ACJJTC_005553 [Scirpophaga incertulas]
MAKRTKYRQRRELQIVIDNEDEIIKDQLCSIKAATNLHLRLGPETKRRPFIAARADTKNSSVRVDCKKNQTIVSIETKSQRDGAADDGSPVPIVRAQYGRSVHGGNAPRQLIFNGQAIDQRTAIGMIRPQAVHWMTKY